MRATRLSLAHPKRYMYMTKEDYFRLKDKGYKFQLNLFSLAGVYGARPAKYAAYLMKEGFYDYAGPTCIIPTITRETSPA
ncbi:MAG: hypothetical protein ACLR6J_13960 [Parabacteroides merdae]